MLVEQVGICLREIRTLEKGSLMDEARSMLNKLLTAQAVITKAEAWIQVNEQKLAAVRERLTELGAVKKLVQEDLTAHSSKLESLQTQLATKRFLSEEELWIQVWAKVEKAAQQEMQRLREWIYSLAEQDN